MFPSIPICVSGSLELLCAAPTAPTSACTAPIEACIASIEFLVSAWTVPMSACIAYMDALVSACIAPMFACISAMDSLVSACMAPMRSKIRSTAEPGREMRDKRVVLASTIERCRSDKADERPDPDAISSYILL